MQHLDDGVLNALLDGELTAAERAQADRHLAQCAGCRDRLAEAREFMSEADGLVAAMEVPAGSPRAEGGPSTVGGGPAGGAGLRPHRVDYRALAWAATVVLALGAGYLGGARLHPAGPTAAPQALNSAERAPTVGAASTDRREAGSSGKATTVPDTEARPAVRAAPATRQPAAERAQVAAKRLQQPPADTTPPPEEVPALPRPAGTTLVLRQAPKDLAAAPVSQVALDPAGGEPAIRGGRKAEPAALNRLTIRDVQDFRRIGWDTAVAVLGGSIRLLDGETPAGLDVGTAGEASGLETGRPVVRIRYLLGGRDTVDLLEQRVSAMRQERNALGDSARVFQAETLPGGGSQIRWEASGGFLLLLRSALTVDRLLGLAAQVR